MTNVPISGLPAATTVNDTDLVPVVQIGTPNVTRQATALQVRAPLLRLTGGTMTGDLTLTANLISQDSTTTNYLSVSPVSPTAVNSGNQAMTVSNMDMTDVGGSGTLSDVAFVMTDNGDPGHNSYTAQILYGFKGTVGSTAITAQSLLVQTGRQTLTAKFQPTLYGMQVHYVDQTASKSSLSATSEALNILFEANDLDDGVNRQLVRAFLQRVNDTGTDVVADVGLFFGGEASHHSYNDVIRLTSPYNLSCMNTTTATEASNANAVWLAQGQHIGFDTASAGHALARLSSDGLTLNSTVPVKPGVYATASLPAVTTSNTGAVAFASDARNTGEAGGAGTGCLVTVNNAGAWICVWSGVAPTT